MVGVENEVSNSAVRAVTLLTSSTDRFDCHSIMVRLLVVAVLFIRTNKEDLYIFIEHFNISSHLKQGFLLDQLLVQPIGLVKTATTLSEDSPSESHDTE
jgi:hypothetical protein